MSDALHRVRADPASPGAPPSPAAHAHDTLPGMTNPFWQPRPAPLTTRQPPATGHRVPHAPGAPTPGPVVPWDAVQYPWQRPRPPPASVLWVPPDPRYIAAWDGVPPPWPGHVVALGAGPPPIPWRHRGNSHDERPSSGSDDDDPDGFPTEIVQLRRLRVLSLACCDLESVPPLLGQLSSLRSLVLTGNRPHAMRHAFFFLPQDMRALFVRSTKPLAHAWHDELKAPATHDQVPSVEDGMRSRCVHQRQLPFFVT